MIVQLTRRVEFSASHICADPALTPAENRALYGDDANPHGHGHNFVLEVTLSGQPDPVTGMVIDLKEVKDILNREVVEPMDHRHLNFEVPPFDSTVPTTENLAIEIWRRLSRPFGDSLSNVRLYESPDLYVDYSERPA